MTEWLRIALSGPVVRRGLKYAVGVGVVLAAINHGDMILRGRVTTLAWAKITLTTLVPYCVSVLSSVGAILDFRGQERAPSSRPGDSRR